MPSKQKHGNKNGKQKQKSKKGKQHKSKNSKQKQNTQKQSKSRKHTKKFNKHNNNNNNNKNNSKKNSVERFIHHFFTLFYPSRYNSSKHSINTRTFVVIVIFFIGILFCAPLIWYTKETGIAPIIVQYHPKMYRLYELLYYGLTGDAFDPNSSYILTNKDFIADYDILYDDDNLSSCDIYENKKNDSKKDKFIDNPMLNLRSICQTIQKNCKIDPNDESKRKVICQPYFDSIAELIIAQTLFGDDEFYSYIYQWYPSLISSILDYLHEISENVKNGENVENIGDFKREYKGLFTQIHKLANFMKLNCFVNFAQGEYVRHSYLSRIGIDLRANASMHKDIKIENDNNVLICKKYPIIISGGAISGLITALSAYNNGFPVDCINIFEKRNVYSRTIVFDLYDRPKYETVLILNSKFGFARYQNVDKAVQSFGKGQNRVTYYAVLCQIMERFLAKIVFMVGIDIYYSFELIGFNSDEYKTQIDNYANSDSNSDRKMHRLLFKNHNNNKNFDKYLVIDNYSVLIGSDGFKSQVRSSFNISYDLQSKIYDYGDNPSDNVIKYFQPVANVKTLHQTSIIVDYQLNLSKFKDGQAKLSTEKDKNAGYMAFVKPNIIDLCFPRCHSSKCQLQILFNKKFNDMFDTNNMDFDEINKQLKQFKTKINNNDNNNSNENDYDDKIEKLFNVCNEAIYNATTAHFQESEEILNHVSGWQLRKNEIILAKDSLIYLDELKINPTSDVRYKFVYLIGESAMSAHYRLGIGTNTILDGFNVYMQFFQLYWAYYDCIYHNVGTNTCDMVKHEDLFDSFHNLKFLIEKRLKIGANYQATRMFLEADCSLMIHSNPMSRIGIKYEQLFKRNLAKKQLSQIKTTNLTKVIRKCLKKQK